MEDNIIVPQDWVPSSARIKVIGVGGGGCNAVTYMFNQKIEGCNFIVCNTDAQALGKSNVPNKIQLGAGLGAGTDPSRGRKAALESQDEIASKLFDDGKTQMLFITAGMGGGTGTGASPVIAQMAKERGILTVAVVTLPFKNEGNESQSKASDGILELEKNVDSLLLINNEKLYEYFGDELVQNAFPHADEVLAIAVRGIIEIIQKPGYINVDFMDVTNMMKDSGMALMGSGTGTGEHRLEDALKGAFESPLLNDFDLKTCKNVLINITAGNNDRGLMMNELSRIDDMVSERIGKANKFKRGVILDETPEFGDQVKITVIATGFDKGSIGNITKDMGNTIILDDHFQYNSNVIETGEEIDLPQPPTLAEKIGFNTMENRRKFSFTEKPLLCVDHNQNIGELEAVPAIRRINSEKK
ncbi:MAG: cell division protein FtsZ [Bacteroidales bacterium]|nr:cell division protein FtsZ [Bacteroidales bacterium]